MSLDQRALGNKVAGVLSFVSLFNHIYEKKTLNYLIALNIILLSDS